MSSIRLGSSQHYNIKQIRNYFDYNNLMSLGNGPHEIASEVAAEIAYHLNDGADTGEAIEMFYGASHVFENMAIFKGQSRLVFRDRCTQMLEKWLAQDFDANGQFNHQMIAKLFGAFGNFDVRMPDRLHSLMKDKVQGKVDLMNAKHGARVFGYYARTADFITAEIFDAIAPTIVELDGLVNTDKQMKLLSDLATIDTMRRKGVVFNHHTPKSVFAKLAPHIEPFLGDAPPVKFKIAKEWFTGQPFFAERGAELNENAAALKARLTAQGLSVQDAFDTARVAPVRTGVDFVVAFEGAKSVGVIADTRTGYVSTIGQPKLVKPNGKSFLNSAFVEKINEGEVIVRVMSNVAKDVSSRELAEALRNASNLDAGVYGLNQQREVVPLSHLHIAL